MTTTSARQPFTLLGAECALRWAAGRFLSSAGRSRLAGGWSARRARKRLELSELLHCAQADGVITCPGVTTRIAIELTRSRPRMYRFRLFLNGHELAPPMWHELCTIADDSTGPAAVAAFLRAAVEAGNQLAAATAAGLAGECS
jgi:hypothetical protein